VNKLLIQIAISNPEMPKLQKEGYSRRFTMANLKYKNCLKCWLLSNRNLLSWKTTPMMLSFVFFMPTPLIFIKLLM